MNVPFEKTQLQSTLRRMGNSTGMILPKAILDQLGLAAGTKVDLRVEGDEVIARPVKRKVREGWEEAAMRIGAEGLTQEDQEWLEFDDPIEGEWPVDGEADW